jgi:hypothetical protein
MWALVWFGLVLVGIGWYWLAVWSDEKEALFVAN